MNLKFLAGIFPLLLLSASAWQFFKPLAPEAASAAPAEAAAPGVSVLEPAVSGAYAPFEINRIFVVPAGPKGLEYSPALRSLDGKNVRLAGSMVRHHHEDPSIFLLTEQPMVLNVAEYGLADDLPPNAVHVVLPVRPGMAPDWVRQPIVVHGRLELGTRQEMDGRISQVRLYADHITAADGRTVIEPRRSVMLQPTRIESGKLHPAPFSTSTSK